VKTPPLGPLQFSGPVFEVINLAHSTASMEGCPWRKRSPFPSDFCQDSGLGGHLAEMSARSPIVTPEARLYPSPIFVVLPETNPFLHPRAPIVDKIFFRSELPFLPTDRHQLDCGSSIQLNIFFKRATLLVISLMFLFRDDFLFFSFR